MVDTVKSGDRLAEWMLKNLDDTEINRFIAMRERTHVISVLAPEAVHYRKKGKYAEEEKTEQPEAIKERAEEEKTEEGIKETEKAIEKLEEKPATEQKHALEQSLREQLHGLLNGLLGKKREEASRIKDIPPPAPPAEVPDEPSEPQPAHEEPPQPGTAEETPLPPEAGIVVQVLDLPELGTGIAHLESPLTQNRMLRFGLDIRPKDSLIAVPVVTLHAMRNDGAEIDCSAQKNLLKLRATYEGKDISEPFVLKGNIIEMPFSPKNAVDAGFKSAYSYIESRQKLAPGSVTQLRIELHVQAISPVQQDAVAKITFVRIPPDTSVVQEELPIEHQPAPEPEIKIPEEPQEKHPMEILLDETWEAYKKYCEELTKGVAPLFNVRGAQVTFAEYRDGTNVAGLTKGQSPSALIMIHDPRMDLAIVLPNPQYTYHSTIEMCYEGLTEALWRSFLLNVNPVRHNEEPGLRPFFTDVVRLESVCIVSLADKNRGLWEIMHRGKASAVPATFDNISYS